MKNFIFFALLFLSLTCHADVLDRFPLNWIRHTYHIPPILFTMLLTATLETSLLWCFKYRGWKILSYFFTLNLISNLLVNLIYQNIFGIIPKDILIFSLELAVVIFEVGFLGLMTKYNKKLWVSVFSTNLFSFLLGVFLFGV